MSTIVAFSMWGPFRESLIEAHRFYMEQAQKRLLSQFSDIDAEANKASREWIAQTSHLFDPERHDPSDFYETANEVGIEFYELLSDMRRQVRLSVVAGMFHAWDKQLRDWLVREIQHWHQGDNVKSKVWSVDFSQIADLLQAFGWDLRSASYFHTLDACRLLVNVYKHGDGKCLEELRSAFPEYLDDPLGNAGIGAMDVTYRDHTHLMVNDVQMQAFSEAIVAFWQEVPERVFVSQITGVPDWFEKAFIKDRPDLQQANRK